MNSPFVTQNPLLMSGTPCFAGTRVPVKSLFDYLEAGDTLDEFLDQFPTVNREVAVNVLEASRLALTAPNNRVETALRFVPGLLNVLASLKVGQLVKLTLD